MEVVKLKKEDKIIELNLHNDLEMDIDLPLDTNLEETKDLSELVIKNEKE